MIALPLLRVSTDKQAASGAGRELQFSRIQALCQFKEWPMAEPFEDLAVSGVEEIRRRPGLLRLIDAYRSYPEGEAVVVVYDVARLSRSPRILWELLDDRGEYRLTLVSATESFDTTTPMGRAALGMCAVFAKLEWDKISERNRAMQAAVIARGGKLGRKRRVSPEVEAKVREMHAAGGWTEKSLADELNRRGIPGPDGRRWIQSTVHRVLARE